MNPTNGRRVGFPDVYPNETFEVVNGEAGVYIRLTATGGAGPAFQINHDATPWHYLDNWKWFLNEEGVAYDYDPEHQAEHFPNDDHTPYDTKEEAEAAAEDEPDFSWDPDAVEEIVGHIRREDGTVVAFRIDRTGPGYGFKQWGEPTKILGRNVSLLETITAQLNGDFE